jgi:hypothetical protein
VQLQGGMWNCNMGERSNTKKRSEYSTSVPYSGSVLRSDTLRSFSAPSHPLISVKNKNKNKQTGGIKVKKNGTKKQRKQPKKYKGGEYVGQGSFGILFGKPRLPCAGVPDTHYAYGTPAESITDVQRPEEMTQVGKIYENDFKKFRLQDTSRQAEQEMDVVRRLRVGGFNIDEMSQYFILPIKMCQINRDALGPAPYNPPYNDPAWRLSQNGLKRNNKILNSTTELPDKWNTMVVSKLGTSDIAAIITNSDSNPIDDINLFYNLSNLLNVVIGVQKIQERGFIHGDLKAVNIIAIDGTFKIGDNSDLRSIADDKATMLHMPEAFEYYVWPSIVIYSVFFIPKKPYNAASPYKNASDKTKVVMKNPKDILNKLYMEQESFNDGSIRIEMVTHLMEPFLITLTIGFTQAQVDKTITNMKTLVGQKLFNYNLLLSDFNKCNSASTFKDALNNNDSGIRTYFNSFNDRIQKFPDMASQKMDLLKRVDIYSLGLVILTCVGEYIKYKKKYTEQVLKPDVIIELYDLVYLCCNQDVDYCPDIDAIAAEYDRILTELRPPPPPPPPPPVPSEDNMQEGDDQPPPPGNDFTLLNSLPPSTPSSSASYPGKLP